MPDQRPKHPVHVSIASNQTKYMHASIHSPTHQHRTKHNQVQMRAKAFHVIVANTSRNYFFLGFFSLAFLLHVVLSILMIVRFIHGVKSLAQVRTSQTAPVRGTKVRLLVESNACRRGGGCV